MKATEIKDVVRDAIRNPQSMPAIYLWGGPGIGKSSVIKQAAMEEDVGCIDIRLSLLDPTDLRGIPIPEDGHAKWLAPEFLPRGGKGIFFLDELNCAPPLVAASALQLVLDRKIGEYSLPDGWCIISAGNREMEAFVHRLSPPLLNRFMHIEFSIDMDEWIKWAMKNDIDPRIVSFLGKYRPELLYKFSSDKRSFPTPRSWEFVSKIFTNSVDKDLRFELISGCVGEGCAIELETYQQIWSKLPDLDKILNSGDNTIPEDIDILYACCIGLASKAKEQKHYDRLINYALKLNREYTFFLIKLLFNKDKNSVIASPNWSKFAKTTVSVEKLLQ